MVGALPPVRRPIMRVNIARALEAMEKRASDDYRGTALIDGAGHWIQQERPAEMLAAFREAMLR